jgi:hypothetical protein
MLKKTLLVCSRVSDKNSFIKNGENARQAISLVDFEDFNHRLDTDPICRKIVEVIASSPENPLSFDRIVEGVKADSEAEVTLKLVELNKLGYLDTVWRDENEGRIWIRYFGLSSVGSEFARKAGLSKAH